VTVDTLGRGLRLYRRTATSRSAILLVVANLIPLVGVLVFGWSLWTILVLYWVENGIVGFWNVPKILLAQGAVLPMVVPPIPDDAALAATGWDPAKAATLRARWEAARQAQQHALEAAAASASGPPGASAGAGGVAGAGRAGLAVFFVMHYGIFWFVHGIFVFMLPLFLGGSSPACAGPDELSNPFAAATACTTFGEIVWPNVVIAAAVLFISHGASFLFNYVGRAEYLTTSPMRQMGAPYGRVVILHLTILFGAFAVAALGAPIGALLILVGLKTAFDLGLHLRERHTADARIPADTAYGKVVRGS
jgi:hypothetical protein